MYFLKEYKIYILKKNQILYIKKYGTTDWTGTFTPFDHDKLYM